jgi:preprotein translocase subunit SecG
MKTKNMIWIASLFIALVIALVVTTFDQPIVSAQNLGAASISLQTTPTPAAEGVSVIGSTDGIFIMGVIIVLIVIIPVLFHRKKN